MAQDVELGLKCEIPLDAILAKYSFVQISKDNDNSYQWETKHLHAKMAPMRISRFTLDVSHLAPSSL